MRTRMSPRSTRRPLLASLVFASLFALASSSTAQGQRFEARAGMGMPKQSKNATFVDSSDVDGDGDLDLVVGALDATRLFLNDGRGALILANNTPLRTGLVRYGRFVDVDGDGDEDLIGGDTKAVFLYENRRGRFVDVTSVRMPPLRNKLCVDLADIDGDKDLDLVLAGGSFGARSQTLLRNDGKGKFTISGTLPRGIGQARFAHFTDIDGDGRQDLFVVHIFGVSLYVQASNGAWRDETTARWLVDRTARVAGVVDLNGDGRLDIVTEAVQKKYRVALNDGKGSFRRSVALQPSTLSLAGQTWIRAIDMDEDGDRDLAIADVVGNTAVWEQTGPMLFRVAPKSWVGTTRAGIGHFADIDRDGDHDLVVGGGLFPTGTQLLVNHARQVHAATSPQIGKTWRLDSHVWTPANASTVVNYVALQALSRRVRVQPFGDLALDPLRSVALLALDMKSSTASQRLQVPNLAKLRGATVYVQGVVIPKRGLQFARLTNLWFDRIR